jgi:hypothetical protein
MDLKVRDNGDKPGLFSVQPQIDSIGTLTFTPAPNVEGIATITVTLQDDGGTAENGQDTSQPATFTIEVTKPHRWHNSRLPHGPPGVPGRGAMDVDDDENITPTDFLLIVNYLNAPRALFPTFIAAANQIANGSTMPFYDVDADDNVTPTDVVLIVNVLNAGQGGPVAGEGASSLLGGEASGQTTHASLAELVALLSFDVAEAAARRRRGGAV